MTAQDLIDLMPIVADRGWTRHGPFGYVRDNTSRCPVCALAYVLTDGAIDFHESANTAMAELFGARLSSRELDAIAVVMEAADGGDIACAPRLFAALGVAA